jgi:hypothetical protein
MVMVMMMMSRDRPWVLYLSGDERMNVGIDVEREEDGGDDKINNTRKSKDNGG